MDLEQQYDKIYRYCYFKLQNRELAEDITQETFLRFLESTGYRDNGKVLQYLYTIARNLCMDEFRRKKTLPLPDGETAGDAEADSRNGATDSLLSKIALEGALMELTGEERELLLLRYVNEVPVSIVCRLFGASRFAVYRKTTGALKKLQKRLREEDFS